MNDHGADNAAPGAEMPPEVPDFELIRPIGEGGFGQVWLATNRTTGHLRAVKLIPLRRSGTADPAGREIMSLTRLEANLRRKHQNLLFIHHVGQTASHLFYVMDAADDVSGSPASLEADYQPATLERKLEDGPLPPGECLRCAGQLLSGLASLHASGMVHRDVKPSNCLFIDGQLKLADFGLLTEAGPQVSRVGTRTYMPPDGRMDARADVYATGLVLYEMISGLPAASFPRLGEKGREVVEDVILNRLMRLALRACQPDPHQRYENAQQVLAELEPEARPEAGKRHPWRPVAVSAASVLVALVAVVCWLNRPQRVDVNFVTEKPYFEATIFLDGRRLCKPDGSPYTTPCTVESLPATVHHVVFKHEGLPDRDAGLVDFREVRQIVARWDTEP